MQEDKSGRTTVDVKFAYEWSREDRLMIYKTGIENSIDEIITSLHQPLDLKGLIDDKYKSAIDGRINGSSAVRTLLNDLSEVEQKLGISKKETKKFIEKEAFVSGTAEKNAKT